jgi:phage protein D
VSNPNLARRAAVEIAFAGVDITSSIRPYLLSMSYTDNEADETDDLQLQLQDRDGIWMKSWLGEAIDAASAAKLQIEATILRENWNGDGKDKVLPCGQFELDSVSANGPPCTVTIKATSLPFSTRIRQTLNSKAWESYTLSGIANEMAKANGMVCMYEAASDPFYDRAEQYKCSDIDFLSKLCADAGISLKVTNNILVLFDQAAYEAKTAVLTIKCGDGSYINRKLNTGTADTQYASCRVSYVDPTTKKCIEGIAKIDDYNDKAKNNQQLEITAKVGSIAEAQALAEKRLRLHNKYEQTATFTMPGDPDLVAGVTVLLEDWGAWSGKYIITQAKHTVGSSGYTVQIKLRKALEGY